MTKLNPKAKAQPVVTEISANGNMQVAKSDAQKFFETVVGHMYGKDQFYKSNDKIVEDLGKQIRNLVAANKLDYIANVIVYARSQLHMRSMPIVATVQFAQALREQNKVFPQLRTLVADVIQRADQITDMYAVSLETFGSKSKVPMAIKRGVGDAFNKFTEYHFGKYNGSTGVTFKDVLRITHPEPASQDQSNVFGKIIENALAVPYTWETELSMNGQLAKELQKSKAQLWSELVQSGKLGYMALLRNLRNIVESGASVYDEVAARISDPEQISRSKQFPFSFLKAFDAVKDAPAKLRFAVSKALDVSCGNIPELGKNVWLIVDGSGSMLGAQYLYNRHEHMGECPFQTAAVFCAALAKANSGVDNLAVTIFSDSAKMVDVNPNDSVTTIVERLRGMVQGGGTNLQAALDLKPRLGFEPDTVVILSDMQVNQLTTGHYRSYAYGGEQNTVANISKLFKPGTLKVAMNLASGTSTPVPLEHGFIQLAGFSERVFALVPELRNSRATVEKLFSTPFGKTEEKRVGLSPKAAWPFPTERPA